MPEDGWADGLYEKLENIFSLCDLMNHVKLCKGHLVISRGGRQQILGIGGLYRVNIDV